VIKLFNVNMPSSAGAALVQTLNSGYIGQGQKVEEFERTFATFIGWPHVASVNSCTSALTLALELAGAGRPHSAVITTPMTCSATNLPILHLGAEPVFADIDAGTGLISIDSVEELLRKHRNVRAIMATDWGGAPVDVAALMDLGKHYDVKVIVDGAHAFGTAHNAMPDFICYSFQAIKHITTGDGGMLVCRNEGDLARARLLRWFGIDRDHSAEDSRINEDITEAGYKFHMNDLAATLGTVQLRTALQVLHRHERIRGYYQRHIMDEVGKPPANNGSSWLYTLRFSNRNIRDRFKRWMAGSDIQVSQVHRRNDEYTVFKKYPHDDLVGLDEFTQGMVCIPIHPDLSDDQMKAVVAATNTFIKTKVKVAVRLK
jgi:dTDP-4-amino-4,6-dideoxygalactose transaminase